MWAERRAPSGCGPTGQGGTRSNPQEEQDLSPLCLEGGGRHVGPPLL